jgi:hypothetical protein
MMKDAYAIDEIKSVRKLSSLLRKPPFTKWRIIDISLYNVYAKKLFRIVVSCFYRFVQVKSNHFSAKPATRV